MSQPENFALDAIASFEVLAYSLAGGLVLVALIVTGYVIGMAPLAFSTAIAGVPLVSLNLSPAGQPDGRA